MEPNKLPEGRKPLPDAWFKERAQMQERLDAAQRDAKEAEAYAGEMEAKLAKAEWLLIDAAVQLEEGRIKTRRNRAELIRHFLAELTGGKDE